ncbi:fumarylacetoacetate hydrolase family protein [Adhaeretor mobilis]|uniref:Ureidoglycolate lyase n=1 Tax=Adhaeretor mobilis TaxID=1930276 RepID=A0A517MSS6_9BACT|nr:fumarylacetoacetate hydrolase family protein [Adhaeretor mobilis]QDS97933.1 Ureidoglycolate lyase [Adhaeretor mobilis]
MKLLRYGSPGNKMPGLLDDTGTIRSLANEIEDLAGEALHPDSLARLTKLDTSKLPAVEGQRLGPCITGTGKIVCIGLNYKDHAAESGSVVPPEPTIFMKATSAISGPNDDVVIPRGSEKTDYEVELAFVIGQHAKYVTEADALDYVAGYCVMNDLSERAFQKEHSGQWVKGKSCDTFAPLGPWLVTKDEIPDPQNLSLWLEVDGQRRQDSSTKHMMFPVAFIVSYLSRFMSLHPGDIISTGTPPGVGMGMDPPGYLQPGQIVRLGVEGLGEQEHQVVAE